MRLRHLLESECRRCRKILREKRAMNPVVAGAPSFSKKIAARLDVSLF